MAKLSDFSGKKSFFRNFDVTKRRLKRIIDETKKQQTTKTQTLRQSMTSEELNITFIELKDTAYRYAVALLGNRVEAEDAVQDLYEKFWRRRLLIRQKSFRALLMTSVRNICMDRLRDRERRRSELIVEPPPIEPSSTDEDLSAIIHRLIEQLPDKEREVIHLRDVEEWQFEDIASTMGISENAARMALSRARQKIKGELSKIMSYGL